MVGTTDTVLIREVSFIEKFHCTGCCGVLVGACTECGSCGMLEQVLRMVGCVESWVRYIYTYIANNATQYHAFIKQVISCIITAFSKTT